jgi:glycosyltransferase involved in cell wall biosynthesis
MRILLIEPFFTGSHRQWALDYQSHSGHEVELLTLEGRHWKWRMHGGAVELAAQFNASDCTPDLILVTDMLDLTTFLSLTRKRTAHIPSAVYFHENQLTYPWSATDADVQLKRDMHYAFINYTSALAADHVLFNSDYHRTSFLSALPAFLDAFPDHRTPSSVEAIDRKSEVLHLGLDLAALDAHRPNEPDWQQRAVILWNHRWEYDKNPEQFFNALFTIQDRGWDFKLVVLGEQFRGSPAIFAEAKERLAPHILHWGYVESREEYVQWLWRSDILPVTSHQDFFGGSVVEAMHCNVKPLLPKRLAYPEHLPSFVHPAYFYDEDDFTDRLHRWIKDIKVLRRQQTRSFVQHYDWSVLVAEYDRRFGAMANH